MKRNEKGNVMIFVVLTFAVLFILTMTAIFIGNSSFKHVDKEENKTQAYYVAKTGAESVIKHLENTLYDTGDMRPELVDLLKRSEEKEFGEGEYKDGDFEIEVIKEPGNNKDGDDVNIYKIISTGQMKNKAGKDRITAVITPKYKSNDTWGTGTIDAGGKDERIDIEGLHNLSGGGMILNVEQERKVGKGGPIHIKHGYSPQKGKLGPDILELFEEDKLHVGDHYLDREVKGNNVIKEILLNDKYPEMDSIEFNYGIKKDKPLLSFPSKYGSGEINSNLIIDVNNPKTSLGELVNEEYEVINYYKDGKYKKEIKNQEFLKINASEFKLDGKNTFITSNEIDIVIYTKTFFLDGDSTINVKGPGNVYIFADGQADIHERSVFGSELDDKDYVTADTNIHFYVSKGTNFGMEDGSKVKSFFLYGPESRIGLDDNSVFTGRMTVNTVDFTGKSMIQSPVPGKPDKDKSPIEGFESIEWERDK